MHGQSSWARFYRDAERRLRFTGPQTSATDVLAHVRKDLRSSAGACALAGPRAWIVRGPTSLNL